MDAVSIIAQIIAGMESEDTPMIAPSFFYGDDAEQNFAADNDTFPAAYLNFPFETIFDIKQSGYVVEECVIDLFFCDKVKMDASPAEQLIVIREMMHFVKTFLSRVQDNSNIRSFRDPVGTGVQNLFDVNVTGVLLSMVIEFVNDDPICP